jgi:hypothetical protein
LGDLAERQIVLSLASMTHANNRDTMLAAFDRLFERAASKLNFDYTPEQREEARRTFAQRYDETLDALADVDLPSISEPALARMEAAIDEVSPTYLATHLATAPLAIHLQEAMRQIAARKAEQRVLEHLINQADPSYGGN